ncbi:signal peptidase I [Carnobacterium mobile]|uniref:signal peptidase I n=1 Tax=Carnobacterium mobile TaxID=2750 RepID=UPI00068DE280|nr:signal peptidase I [Carnobacterium mobile]
MKTIKTILNSVATLVVLLFVGIAAVSFFSAPKASGLFGYKNYTVVSGSMEPVLSPGDFIFVEMKPYQAVKEKDLITFSSNDEIVTHRVVRKSAEWLTELLILHNLQAKIQQVILEYKVGFQHYQFDSKEDQLLTNISYRS